METRNGSGAANDIVTPAEAADYLGTSLTTVRNMVYHGRLVGTRDARSGRLTGVTVDSVMAIDREYPRDSKGRRHWGASGRIEPYIYAEPRMNDRRVYRVRVHGHKSRTFRQLRSAQMYRDSIVAGDVDRELTNGTNGHTPSIWNRMFGWLGASKSPIA